MYTLEEKLKGSAESMVTQKHNIESRQLWYNAKSVRRLSIGWVSPEDYGMVRDKLDCAEERVQLLEESIDKLKSQLEKQKIPEVPQFVADWYEENKKSLEWNICKTVTRINENTSHDEFDLWFCDTRNKPIETIFSMKNDYTVAKDKRFYLKHIEMSRRDTYHDYYAQIRNERFEHDSVETGMLPQPEITGVIFTQEEINNMETRSYEQIPVEDK